MVSTGLNRAFGAPLRRFISQSTSNRFKSCAAGVVVATALQSSTATSLIVSSFAARGIITIPAAIALMLGADVGSTLATQLMSLDLSWLVPVLLTSGYVVNKTMEQSQYKHVGRAMIGIGLALLALKTITSVAAPLQGSVPLQTLISPLVNEPILAILVSTLLTWLVHSGMGMVLLYMSFVVSGTIPVTLGLYFVLGANIGSALAPVIMTLRDIPAGRRVPLGNLVIKVLGVILVMPFMKTLIVPFFDLYHADPARLLVNFHTAFNLLMVVAFLPFIGPLTRISEVILPDRPREEDEGLPHYLDPTAITTPPAALACAARETLRISDIVEKMMHGTLEAFRTNNPRLVQEIRDKERIVDSLYESVKIYLTRISSQALDAQEGARYMQIMTFSTNLEHIGDIIDKNLMEMASKKIRNQDNFSRQGFAEIATLHSHVMQNLSLAQNVFMTGDIKMARQLFEGKAAMRTEEMQAAESHFRRLSEGVAETIATSSLHLDILRDLRRINSYVSLVAYTILEEAKELNPTRLKPSRQAKAKSGVSRPRKAPAKKRPVAEKES